MKGKLERQRIIREVIKDNRVSNQEEPFHAAGTAWAQRRSSDFVKGYQRIENHQDT